MKQEEQWKSIPGFPDYKVSNMGRVRSYKWKNRGPNAPHILKPGLSSGNYWTVTLRRNGKNHIFNVGRLVLLAFHGPCPEGCEVCHNDGNRTNDHLDNLRWDTHAANMQDAVKHGTLPVKSAKIGMQMNKIMNHAFVEMVRREQERREDNQTMFSKYLGISQGALSKFYTRGVKDNVTIKILRKYPHFAIFFRSENHNEP